MQSSQAAPGRSAFWGVRSLAAGSGPEKRSTPIQNARASSLGRAALLRIPGTDSLHLLWGGILFSAARPGAYLMRMAISAEKPGTVSVWLPAAGLKVPSTVPVAGSVQVPLKPALGTFTVMVAPESLVLWLLTCTM